MKAFVSLLRAGAALALSVASPLHALGGLAFVLTAAAASGEVVNIDAAVNGSPYYGFPQVEVPVTPGHYRATLATPSTNDSALYTAWSYAYGAPGTWRTQYRFRFADGATVIGGSVPDTDDAQLAFDATVEKTLEFDVATSQTLEFHVIDSEVADNVGGVSLELMLVEDFFAGGGKDAANGNDCLIGYNGIDPAEVTLDGKQQVVKCTDCDPTCDYDGEATANGSCMFKVGVCINQSGVEGCAPPSALDKASAKGKVKGVKGSDGKIVIDVSQLLADSACGAFLDVVTPISAKKGEGRAIVNLSALVKKNKAEGIPKARKDKDMLTYVCVARPEGEACP